MKNVTLSADEQLIEAARARARANHTTLNAEFRRWLAEYAAGEERVTLHQALLKSLRAKVKTGGRRFSREEMNDR